MNKRSRWMITFLMVIIPVLAACETVDPGTPSPAPQAIAGQPTRTVKPIVSFTPRFTATPIPSITPIPSETLPSTATVEPPTVTASPSPTATATVQGIVESDQKVNLRAGPGFDFPIVVSVDPGTELGILSFQMDSNGFEWYQVGYISEDGDVQHLWVRSNLVETSFDPYTVQVSPLETPSGVQSSEPNAGVTPEPNRVDILAYCRQKFVRPETPTTEDKVYIEWSWFVSRPEFMDEHLDNANYDVQLDDESLDNWQAYATEIKQEAGRWIIYWYYPVGKLSAGEHTITFRLTWDETITDGYQDFGPDTNHETDEGNCTFTVVEAND